MLDQFIGQTLADKYRINSVMRDGGGGGLGRVYRATHLLMDKPVTVKILAPAHSVDENIVKRFSNEARTVSRIAHPNILNVTDFGTDVTGATYIIFESADGATLLRDEIIREGALPFERAANIARQIVAALAAAHAGGTIHRGLTSENILLARAADGAELVKVLDFGAVAEGESDSANDAVSRRSLEYLSPEQNASVAEADERSDIYSLGVIFYEMLSGEVPYAADNAADLLLKQAHNPPAPLSAFRADLPAAVEPVILRALAKNPDLRYQTAAEFAADLDEAAGASGETETVVIPRAANSKNVRNNMWKTAFVVLAGISLLAISLIYATSSKQTDPATVLQSDANGSPVQPLNPATGINEMGASALTPYSPEMTANSNTTMAVPQPVPNGDGFGDGYNPWARGVPPPGAPPMYQQIPPGGQMIDPNNPNSIFMQDGTVLVPVPVNANANANVKPAANTIAKPTPAPAANATATPTATTPPAANVQPIAPPKTPTPAPKPAAQPTKTSPAATNRSAPSGKEQDSQ